MKTHSAKILLPLVAIALSWIVYGLLGTHIASWIASFAGDLLIRLGGGKFDDPAIFIHGRLREALWLVTLTGLLTFLIITLRNLLQHSRFKSVAIIPLALCGFIAINILLGYAGRTVLFWSFFYDKQNIDNFAQFQIKRQLHKEISGKRRAILIGNSQSNRCIDEVILNRSLGEELWTTDLTQPGARGFDMLVISREASLEPGDWVICFVSEIMFYGGGSGIVVADFLHFGDLPELYEYDGWDEMAPGSVKSGLIGQALPSFRFRKSFSQRIFGSSLTAIRQPAGEGKPKPDLEALAEQGRRAFSIGHGSEFQQAGFEKMAKELLAAEGNLILIAGYVNPLLSKKIDPKIGENLEEFTQRIQQLNPDRVSIIQGSDLLKPKPEHFTDLVHFTEPAQIAFTEALESRLQQEIDSATASSPIDRGKR